MAELSAREKAIREKRADLYNGKMVPVLEKLDAGDRLSVEDRATFDQAEQELQELDKDLDLVVKAAEREAGRNQTAETRGVSRDFDDSAEMDFTRALAGIEERRGVLTSMYKRANGERLSDRDLVKAESEYTRAFTEWFRRGDKKMSPAALETLEIGEQESRAELDSASLQTVPGQGGYMIPQGFWMNLQIALKQYGGLLPLCNPVQTASGNEMPWPTANPTGVIGQYITEANQVGFTDYTFGQGILYAWTITSGIILASLQLINDSAFNVDQFVSDRMGEAIGRKVGAELWTGAGSASKALTGITTAITANGGSGSGALSSPGYAYAGSAVGATTAATVDPGFSLQSPSSTTNLGASQVASWQDLTNMIASVDVAYRSSGRCVFVMNDTQVQRERTLTDGFGHPLWEPNTQAGQPDVILGYPVVVDNNAPSVAASTTSSIAGGVLFGDLKTPMVVRQVNMAGTMRLTERYADYLQVGYLGYVRMDAQPNDLRAVISLSNIS